MSDQMFVFKEKLSEFIITFIIIIIIIIIIAIL